MYWGEWQLNKLILGRYSLDQKGHWDFQVFLPCIFKFVFTWFVASFKISNAVIATSISIPNQYVAFRISKKKKGGKGKENGNLLFLPIYYSLLLWFTFKKKKAYTPHVLHLPIYYISHLFTHFTTTIYLPILLQQFLLVLLYLLSMYRLTNYPFIILQLYL